MIGLTGVEDGVEFDKGMMVREKLETVEGAGPAPRVLEGRLPEAPAVPVRAKQGQTTMK